MTPLSLLRPLADPVLASLPLAPIDAVLARTLALMLRRHPKVFLALDDYRDQATLVMPEELPLVLRFVLHPTRPRLTAHRPGQCPSAKSSIRGPLMDLIGMLEGRIDGDALFFSRRLTIEGDTAMIVALRNVLEAAEIDLLADSASLFGPAAGPVELLGRKAFRFARRLRAQIQPAVP